MEKLIPENKRYKQSLLDRLHMRDEVERQFDGEKLQAELDAIPVIETTEHQFDRVEVEALAKTSLDFLASLALPDEYRYGYPKVLLAIWALLLQFTHDPSDEFPQLALGIPRGHAKTTIIKLYILYCILFTKKRFILVIASTAPRASDILADIATMLDQPNIRESFGSWSFMMGINRNDMKTFNYRGRNIVIASLGAESAVRGMNVGNVRPDVMIFEDIQTKECSESLVQSSALERWMIGTAMKAKNPNGCIFIFVGNMYPGPNSILKKIKDNPTWTKFISGAILMDGSALWEAHRSIKSLIKELDNDIAMGHPEIFFSEVLNDTEAGINNTIDLSLIPEWKWTVNDFPQGKFILIDPSTNKIHGDACAIGYFEVYDGTPGLRQVIEEKLSPGNTIRKALLLALQTGTRLIAVESAAYQYSLLYWFGVIESSLGLSGFSFVPVYTGSASKNSRIATMLKSLTAGEVILHPSLKSRVIHQISNWAPMKRDNVDDILDLLSYSTKILELYGNEIIADYTIEFMEAAAARVVEHNSII